MIRFRDLTADEKLVICNGCGGKGHWFDPPDWLFKASCDHHDFNYWLGHTEEDRRKADWQFYRAMIEDANASPWWRRPFARVRAWMYYQAVRRWGAPYFYYGEGYRGRADLDVAIREAS